MNDTPSSGKSNTPAELSKEFVSRLCGAYRTAVENFCGHGDSMWADIDTFRHNVHTALVEDRVSELVEMLGNPTSTRMYYGVDELYDHGGQIGEATFIHTADTTSASIRSFAVALGVARLHNPEGGELYAGGPAPSVSGIEDLLTAIETRIGHGFHFPNPFPEEIGLRTSRGFATTRSVAAIYQAYRAASLCGDELNQPVLEIGAGLGRTAYYAATFGMSNYSIVDLPLSLIGQAVFLGLTLGQDKIRFFDEPAGTARVTLLTPSQFEKVDTPWKVGINVDSMPEMDQAHVLDYVARLKQTEAIFLSINHEANRQTVNELLSNEPKVSRVPYVLRDGYLEELYDFRGASDTKR